jgi:hypothetical protein
MGGNAISLNSCCGLSFEADTEAINKHKPVDQVNNIVDAIKGLSKSFIAV